jgi:hypothetical protein
MKKILFLLLLIPFYMSAQTLSKERIDRLKNSVVKILIDGQSVGTGFFVSNDGGVLTCWHVIVSALKQNADGSLFIQKKISVEFADGYTIPIKGFPKYIWGDESFKASVYDYCLMGTDGIPKHIVEPLKIGKFQNAAEGEQV